MSRNCKDISCNMAASRWTLLKEVILKKKVPEGEGNPDSKRSFERYSDLVSWTEDTLTGALCVGVRVQLDGTSVGLQPQNFQCQDHLATYAFQLHRSRENKIDIKNLKDFDKTGRICIWPAEQVLCYWVLKNPDLFKGKRVIEIGGGFHCLGGMAVAKYTNPKHITLTDGDEENLKQLACSIELNGLDGTDKCTANTLRWDNFKMQSEFESSFDVTIAADVIYHKSIFECLMETVLFLLKPGGQFILFNPERDGVLQEFVQMARNRDDFSDVKVFEIYDKTVSEIAENLQRNNPSFNREWHFPIQIILVKNTQEISVPLAPPS